MFCLHDAKKKDLCAATVAGSKLSKLSAGQAQTVPQTKQKQADEMVADNKRSLSEEVKTGRRETFVPCNLIC